MLTYEYNYEDITLTYPIGGESLVPGEFELIRWDAYNFRQIIKNKIRNLNKQDANYTPLNSDVKRGIFSVYFEEDVAQLEKLLNKKMDWN